MRILWYMQPVEELSENIRKYREANAKKEQDLSPEHAERIMAKYCKGMHLKSCLQSWHSNSSYEGVLQEPGRMEHSILTLQHISGPPSCCSIRTYMSIATR